MANLECGGRDAALDFRERVPGAPQCCCARRRITRSIQSGVAAAALHILAFLAFTSPVVAQNKAQFWLQTDANVSQFGSVTNPTINVRAGRSAPLYVWFNKSSTVLGFDGISFDVRLLSSDGGAATATMTIDMPAGRWTGATGGVSRTDTGGTGVDDCNAFDLTNTDTLATVPARFGTINITGNTRGTIQLFLCIGQFGIADNGQNAVVWLGFAQSST